MASPGAATQEEQSLASAVRNSQGPPGEFEDECGLRRAFAADCAAQAPRHGGRELQP